MTTRFFVYDSVNPYRFIFSVGGVYYIFFLFDVKLKFCIFLMCKIGGWGKEKKKESRFFFFKKDSLDSYLILLEMSYAFFH